MGSHKNITHELYPRQGPYLGRRVRVVFHYDLSHQLGGVVVRDDRESPGEMIIQLDPESPEIDRSVRYVLSSECQWSPEKED